MKQYSDEYDGYLSILEQNQYCSEHNIYPRWKSKAEINLVIKQIKNDYFIHDEEEREDLIKRYEEYASTLPDHYHFPRYDDIEDGWNIIEGIDVYVENNKVMRTDTGERPFERCTSGWISVLLTPTEFAKAVIDDKICWF